MYFEIRGCIKVKMSFEDRSRSVWFRNGSYVRVNDRFVPATFDFLTRREPFDERCRIPREER